MDWFRGQIDKPNAVFVSCFNWQIVSLRPTAWGAILGKGTLLYRSLPKFSIATIQLSVELFLRPLAQCANQSSGPINMDPCILPFQRHHHRHCISTSPIAVNSYCRSALRIYGLSLQVHATNGLFESFPRNTFSWWFNRAESVKRTHQLIRRNPATIWPPFLGIEPLVTSSIHNFTRIHIQDCKIGNSKLFGNCNRIRFASFQLVHACRCTTICRQSR